MRKDHRPFFIKALVGRVTYWYTERFIRPQFDKLGCCPMVVEPRSCEIHGQRIVAGDYLHLISHPLKPIRMTTWSSKQGAGKILLGDHCLISPGVEITAALSIEIGHNTMIAAETVITDSDWHGLYNRTRPFRCTKPITLGDNVWIGMRCFIGKGVQIGENSVIGAGSVVTGNIPANVVAAGNPAKVIKPLNPRRKMLTREFLFRNGDFYWQNQVQLDRYLTAENSTGKWLRTLLRPSVQD